MSFTTSETLDDVLLGIAANPGTVESICLELVEAPDPETIHRYFNRHFPVEQAPELQPRSGPIEVAVDFYDL